MRFLTSDQSEKLQVVADRLEEIAECLHSRAWEGRKVEEITGLFWRLSGEMMVIAQTVPVSSQQAEDVAMSFARFSMEQIEAEQAQLGTRDGADAAAAARTVSL